MKALWAPMLQSSKHLITNGLPSRHQLMQPTFFERCSCYPLFARPHPFVTLSKRTAGACLVTAMRRIAEERVRPGAYIDPHTVQIHVTATRHVGLNCRATRQVAHEHHIVTLIVQHGLELVQHLAPGAPPVGRNHGGRLPAPRRTAHIGHVGVVLIDTHEQIEGRRRLPRPRPFALQRGGAEDVPRRMQQPPHVSTTTVCQAFHGKDTMRDSTHFR